MEHGNDMSIAVTDDSLYSNLDDATVRRMKNRERQRRYRARKRLETDTTSEIINYPSLKRQESDTSNNMKMLVPIPQEVYYASPSNIELPGSETTPTKPNICSRVLSRRDWKNDARRAHTDEQDNNRRFSFMIMENVPLDNNNNGQSSLSISESDEMQKSGPGRRHWKTEARNKS